MSGRGRSVRFRISRDLTGSFEEGVLPDPCPAALCELSQKHADLTARRLLPAQHRFVDGRGPDPVFSVFDVQPYPGVNTGDESDFPALRANGHPGLVDQNEAHTLQKQPEENAHPRVLRDHDCGDELGGLKDRERHSNAERRPIRRQLFQVNEIRLVDMGDELLQAWLDVVLDKARLGNDPGQPFELRVKNNDEQRKQDLDRARDDTADQLEWQAHEIA